MPERVGTTYAAESGFIGFGTQFLVGEGDSPETFSAVAGVESITFGETKFADVDTTHLRSPNRHHEHRSGIRDTSEFTVTGIYMPDEWSLSAAGGGTGAFQNGGMPTLAEDGEARNFIVRFPTSPETDVEIRGYITGFSLSEVGSEDVVKYTFGIMPTQAFDLP